MNKPICCGLDAIWVDNVPGKEYFFCQECRNEVLTPLAIEEISLKRQTKLSDSLEYCKDKLGLDLEYIFRPIKDTSEIDLNTPVLSLYTHTWFDIESINRQNNTVRLKSLPRECEFSITEFGRYFTKEEDKKQASQSINNSLEPYRVPQFNEGIKLKVKSNITRDNSEIFEVLLHSSLRDSYFIQSSVDKHIRRVDETNILAFYEVLDV